MVGRSLSALAKGSTVATGSVRRRAQIRSVRPDLEFRELRGNIGTRLERIPENGAIVMALAALEILGLTSHVAEALDPETFVPMVGQGCVAVEHRFGDARVAAISTLIDHADTRFAVETERAFLSVLGSGCSLPVGAHVDATGTLTSFLASGDESPKTRCERSTSRRDASTGAGRRVGGGTARCRRRSGRASDDHHRDARRGNRRTSFLARQC
jgi:hydroxymethylbilane synthase